MSDEKAGHVSASQLQIGDLARKAGVSIRTVRFYEEKGLLSPSSYTSGGIRLYTIRDVNRLIFIRRLKTLGLTVDEIKLCLGALGTDSTLNARIEHTLRLLNMQRQKLEEQINTLTSLRTEIQTSIEKVTECVHCTAEYCSENCPSREYIL